MFYSHEVLTSRKYGVATVWLVATLGQKSTARKVSRRAILDVDVTKACKTIIAPEAPMALRLQSSLLYGVSRVYSEQCGYVLSDAQHAQATIRALLKVIKTAALDLPVPQAKPEQITLQDDPSFIPGIAFNSELFDLELDLGALTNLPRRYPTDSTALGNSHSQHSAVFSQVGLQLPSSSSVDLGGDFGLGDIPGLGSGRPSSLLRGEEADGGHLLLPDIDLGLDDEGNFIDGGNIGSAGVRMSEGFVGSGALDGDVGGVAAHLGGAGQGALQDDFLPPIDGGYSLPPPEERLSSDNYHPQRDEDDMSSNAEIEYHRRAAAQRRKERIRKMIKPDSTIELRNRQLQDMATGYKKRMDEENKRAATGKNNIQARRNADFFILGRGIGGVGKPVGRGGVPGPLSEMWSGDALYEMLTGKSRVPKITNATKRSAGSDGDNELSTPQRNRNVRPRLDNDEAPVFQEDHTIMRDYGDIEVGREAQEPLEDVSSAMPWNVSASIRGSSVARAGITGSAPGSLTRRGSRLVSASPTVGRGPLSVGIAHSSPPAFADFGGLVDSDAFELHGEGPNVDMQTAGDSQWQRAVLDRESNNFLEFIGEAIVRKHEADDEDINEVEFAELLKEEENSKTVAAQGLLHVLTLGTKNLIRVTQVEAFGPISMALV